MLVAIRPGLTFELSEYGNGFFDGLDREGHPFNLALSSEELQHVFAIIYPRVKLNEDTPLPAK